MVALTCDGVLAVADALGVQALPTVLDIRPRHTTYQQLFAARSATIADLSESGVLYADGAVRDDELATAVLTLAHPHRQLIARIRRHAELIRVCVARRGLDQAVAVRSGDHLEIRTMWAAEDPAALARPLLATLGACPPVNFPAFRTPTADLQQRFDDDTDYAAAAHAVGMPEDAAITLGMALRHRVSTTELVAYSHRDGLATRAPATAAMYDTATGRIVAGATLAADGTCWTTLAPGTDDRLAQVIAAQLETLPEGRWMP